MSPTLAIVPVKIGRFDPAHVFPPNDPLTLPLFRLMLATDDVRHASVLFVMADQQVRETTGIQSVLHGGRMWYLFRLLCAHLNEGGNALNTLLNCVADMRLKDLLRDKPAATEALARLRPAFGKGTFIRNVRDWISSHYRQEDIKRVYERDLAAIPARVDGSLVACEVGVLSHFIVTGVLALHLMDAAAGATNDEEFSERCGEVVDLAQDLSTFVGHLIDALLKERGVQTTLDTIEVPALLRAARDRVERERGTPPGAS